MSYEGAGAAFNWEELSGDRVVVHFSPASQAAHVAARELAEADRTVAALEALLTPASSTDEPVHIYLVDPVAAPTAEVAPDAAGGGTSHGAVGANGIVRVARPEGSPDPIARSLTRLLIPRWFGESAATQLAVEGIAGLVSAQAETGPPIEEADAFVRAQFGSGAPVSVMGSIGPPGPSSPDETPPDLASVSFLAFVTREADANALNTFLTASNPDEGSTQAFGAPIAALEEAWVGSLLGAQTGRTIRSTLAFLLPLMRPHRLRYFEALGYMVLSVLIGLSVPLVSGCVVDALGRSGAPEGAAPPPVQGICNFIAPTLTVGRVVAIVVLLFIGYLLNSLIELRSAYVQQTIFKRITTGLQEKMFGHMQKLSHRFYSDASIGDLSSRLSDDIDMLEVALSQIFGQGVFMVLTSLLAAITAFTQNPMVGALILLLIPAFILTNRFLGSRIGQASFEVQELGGQAQSVALENIQAHAVVKAYGMEERAEQTYKERLLASFKAHRRMSLIGQMFEGSINLATAIGQLLVLGVGASLVVVGTLDDPGRLVTLLLLLPNVLVPVGILASVGQAAQMASGSIQRANEVLQVPVEIEEAPDAKPLLPIKREIVFENVGFGYELERPILKSLDLTIPHGTNAAVVGPSGSGKSTVVNLLLRFWDPDSGRVLIDGTDIREAALDSLRKQIGIVFQDTFIFNTSLRDNIRIGKPDATDDEVMEAIRGAQLEPFLEAQPEGLDTVLGERGSRMSGGQRQRIAIARALLRNPKILILDEATSALDAHTEAEIQETLLKFVKGRTTIAITHRLSSAVHADTIYVFESGRLVEQGPHRQLVAAGGLYQKLYEEQTGVSTEMPKTGIELLAARLQNVPLFAELSPETRGRLAGQLVPERYDSGDDIVVQGEPGDKLYILWNGSADVFVADARGTERKVNSMKAGDFFGELALLTQEPRTATVRATEPVEVYALAQADFVALAEREQTIRDLLTRFIEERRTIYDAAAVAAGISL